MSEKPREIRIECLRPGQLNAERERCPLVLISTPEMVVLLKASPFSRADTIPPIRNSLPRG